MIPRRYSHQHDIFHTGISFQWNSSYILIFFSSENDYVLINERLHKYVTVYDSNCWFGFRYYYLFVETFSLMVFHDG